MPRVLVIEDETPLRSNMLEILVVEGFQVLEAADGDRGIALAHTYQPDLIICDVMLPKLNGYEVLKRLRSQPVTEAIPFIFVTAKATRSDQRRGMDLGADDYLTKPFAATELLSAVNSRLRRQKALTIPYQQELEKARQQINDSLYYDSLTKLPNRLSLRQEFAAVVSQAQQQHHETMIIFIGLDRFNRINDALGHDRGDTVLKHIADRLQAAVQARDRVARLSGDQFALLMASLMDLKTATAFAEQLQVIISAPCQLPDHDIVVTASIGIVSSPQHGTAIDALIKRADVAMYSSKRRGGNQITIYTDELLDSAAREQLSLEADLRHALNRNQLCIRYQPQVSLATGKIIGVEALVRWEHPQRGAIPPSLFIPLAEEIDVIGAIDDWMMQQVAQQLRRWLNAGLGHIAVSVNVSARQFNQPGLLQHIATVIAEAAVDPHLLKLEITETSLVRDPKAAVQTLQALQALGIKIALDDFGTGYSALSYLQQFPFDALKIDQCFIRNVTRNGKNASITEATIKMAHSLNFEVIAEGVETLDELNFLIQHRCEAMQGFLFSPPLSATQFQAILQQGKTLFAPKA
ncbi:MAG: EAL domain-containing protein [Cyanobacteria bacterium P01_H01_bin.121]